MPAQPTHGMVPAAPPGLIVRTRRETVGDGPFRAMSSLRVSVEPRVRTNAFLGVVRAVAAAGAVGNLAAALVAVAPLIPRLMWIVQAVFLGLVFRVLRPDRRPLLSLTERTLELASGTHLPLEDIRRVSVRDAGVLDASTSVYDVVVATADREYDVAGRQGVADARYLAGLVHGAAAKTCPDVAPLDDRSIEPR